MSSRSLLLCVFATLAILCSTGTFALSQDDIPSLKKEIQLLKKEIEVLKREKALLEEELASLKKPEKETSGKSPEGEITTAMWEITYYKKDGKVAATGQFLAADGRIYKNNKEIGVFSEDGNRVRMEVTGADQANANGTYNLLQFQKNPPNYRGNFRNPKGQDFSILLRIIKD